MTSLAPPLPDEQSGTQTYFIAKLVVALGLTALADWLFWDQRIGLSLALFAAALVVASSLANLRGVTRRRVAMATIVVTTGFVPAIEELNLLSLCFVIAATTVSVAILTKPDFSRLTDGLRTLLDLFLIGPFRLIGDVVRTTDVRALSSGLTLWLVPIVFGGVFLFLFASANPLIARWISELYPRDTPSQFNFVRTMFWCFVLSTVWPFIHVRWRRWGWQPFSFAPAAPVPDSGFPTLFGPGTILRALILFNLLFAMQTVLDLIFLWGHTALPDGISYGQYAHRGAYPLIATALLAAGFVLAAMRRDGPAQRIPFIRPLVYLWISQNVLLVISSMLRLYRYMEVYLLTGWRIAALVWMLLVAIGLLLIVARIVLEQSNGWLMRMNLISLTATLYLCSLINTDAFIAGFNVDHSRQAAANHIVIDVSYLSTLGPQVLPALDRARGLPMVGNVDCSRGRLLAIQAADMASWRSWGFRSWRLQRYLDAHPDQPAASDAQ